MNSAEPLRIHRLHLRASPVERRAALTALEHASWPDSGREWVLVRQVKVRAPRAWLGLRVAASVQRAVAAAVPIGAAGAAEAPAIRLASLVELLAHLGADLLLGVASKRWYWQRWGEWLTLPPLSAAVQLWGEQVAYLAAITEVLGRDQRLAGIWPRLGEAGAGRLLSRLAQHSGLEGLTQEPRGDVGALDDMAVSTSLLRRWQPALSGFGSNHPGTRLAAALVILEARPTALVSNAEAALRTVARKLTAQPAPAALGRQAHYPSHPPALDLPPTGQPWATPSLRCQAGRQAKRLLLTGAPPAEVGNTKPFDTADSGADTRQWSGIAAANQGNRAAGYSAPVSSPGQLDRTGQESAEPAFAGTPGVMDETEVRTGALVSQQAGTLYLVNALCHPAISRVVEHSGGWNALPGGWAWLFRLGCELGLRRDDPLVALVAAQLGIPQEDLQALSPLPSRRALLGALERAYGEVWAPDLIEVSGRIHHTASHVDAVLPMYSIRLQVRAAGLDVNPGWVPWLGRVVTLHYRTNWEAVS